MGYPDPHEKNILFGRRASSQLSVSTHYAASPSLRESPFVKKLPKSHGSGGISQAVVPVLTSRRITVFGLYELKYYKWEGSSFPRKFCSKSKIENSNSPLRVIINSFSKESF